MSLRGAKRWILLIQDRAKLAISLHFRSLLEAKLSPAICLCVCKCLCECEIVRGPTDHAVNGAKEHGALGGCGALAQVLQHQRTMAEDIDKLTEVEDPHLLQVLPLLVCSGRTDRRKDSGREIQRGEREEGLQTLWDGTCARCRRVETGANRKRVDQIKESKHI